MKKIENTSKPNFIKKLFIKMCRLMGYEIIDQNRFLVPTSDKKINDTLSQQGIKSINLPLGDLKITRKVKELAIIIRTCTSVNMLTQNKRRIFEKEKIEYSMRSIYSILKSVNHAKKIFKNISFKLIVIDHNSTQDNQDSIKTLLKNSTLDHEFINLDVKEFESNIKKINAENKEVTNNQLSNMSNIHKSIQISKKFNDLIYFVEDDYIHEKKAICEMIFAYERIATQIKSEIILCPTDYPYLYTKAENTKVFLGEEFHWRIINDSLCTFLTSNKIINDYENKLVSMCQFEHFPFEAPLHDIYKEVLCVSPIPSLAIHCTNVNSIYGLSPNKDWERIWDENEI